VSAALPIAERDTGLGAMKFYTEEGQLGPCREQYACLPLVIPLNPDTHAASTNDSRTNMRSAKNNWDFWSSLPEALHQVTIVMSDLAFPFLTPA